MEKWRVQYRKLSDGSEVFNVVVGNHGMYSCLTEGEALVLCEALNLAIETPRLVVEAVEAIRSIRDRTVRSRTAETAAVRAIIAARQEPQA